MTERLGFDPCWLLIGATIGFAVGVLLVIAAVVLILGSA